MNITDTTMNDSQHIAARALRNITKPHSYGAVHRYLTSRIGLTSDQADLANQTWQNENR